MKAILALLLLCFASMAVAQSKTTQLLDDTYEGLSLYFYRNTLRMLNQSEDKDFDELVKDIEKMRFLMIDKANSKFGSEEYKKLLAGYISEDYEEIMAGRFEGRNFNVYMKEKNGEVKGTVLLANDSTSLMVLDILGKVSLDKAPQLFKAIDGSTDVGKKIKNFLGREEEVNAKEADTKKKAKN